MLVCVKRVALSCVREFLGYCRPIGSLADFPHGRVDQNQMSCAPHMSFDATGAWRKSPDGAAIMVVAKEADVFHHC